MTEMRQNTEEKQQYKKAELKKKVKIEEMSNVYNY